jgi:hypothetical protein
MKKILILALVFIGLNTNAQYFQHLYGDPYPVVNGAGMHDYVSGVNTTNILHGHLMASCSRDPSSPLSYGAQVTFTDENGTPIFNNIYSVTQGWHQGAGYYRNLVFESDHTPEIGVVGIADDMGGETVYYMKLDPTGNVLATYGYSLEFITANNWHVRGFTKITESVDGNYIYILGLAIGANQTNQDVDFFVLKVEIATGNLIWSHVYDLGYTNAGSRDMPKDLIESPYLTGNGMELIVVGRYGDVSPTIFDTQGFLLRVDATNGNPIGNADLYKSTFPHNGDDFFTSITVANSPAAGGPGFIIAGLTGDSGPLRNDPSDIWSIKIDPLGNILWQNAYSSAAMMSDRANDVIERLNPFTGRYEYYYGGSTDAPGPNTNIDDDIMVIKTDEWGNVVNNGQLMFDFLEHSRGFELDQFNNAGPSNLNGLSIYANTYGSYYGTLQLMHVKTYFNGFMECNDSRDTPLQFPGPGHVGTTTVSTPGEFMVTPWGPINVTVRQSGDQNICYSYTVPGGSNALKAPGNEGTVSPNPFTNGTHYANLELEVDEPTAVTVEVYDMLGRSYYTHNFTLVKGKNNLNLDISETNMAAGMYSVRITGKNLNKNIMLMVK